MTNQSITTFHYLTLVQIEEKSSQICFCHECRLQDRMIALSPSKKVKINSSRHRYRSTHMSIEVPGTKIKRWCRDKISNNKSDVSNELNNANASTACNER